jgi:hypothetical protein
MSERRHQRRLAVASAALLAATLGLVPRSADATTTPVADCAPHQLPGMPGGDGSGALMWITDSGLYVGGAGAGDGSERAGWWTHTGSSLDAGWTFHGVSGLGSVDAEVLDANNSGVMVGFDFQDGTGFVFDSGSGALSWLPGLDGQHTIAYSRRINASGQVAGGAYDKHGNEVAVVWSPPYAQATRLPDVGASQSVGTQAYKNAKMFSEADGINDAGQAVGTTALGGHIADEADAARGGWLRGGIAPLYQAIVWRNPGIQRLAAGEAQGIGFAINDAGTAVGSTDRPGDPSYQNYPAYWRNGQAHDMGAGGDTVWGNAYGISQGGWAVGGLGRTDNSSRAFVWTGEGSLQELTPLPGADNSWAHAVNDRFGQAGGSSWLGDGPDQATLWQCATGFTTG